MVDAGLGLPVVHCSCGFAAVRRRHPIVAETRRAILAARALLVLALQAFLALVFALFMTALIREFSETLRNFRCTPMSFLSAILTSSGSERAREWAYSGGGFVTMTGFVVLSTAAGVWLRLAYNHWRWPVPLLAWFALVLAFSWIESVVWAVDWLCARVDGKFLNYYGPTAAQSRDRLEIFAVSLPFTAIGILAGFGLARIAHRIRRLIYSRARSKLRRRRRAE